MSLKEGTRVGPYEIGPLLGAGGMGEVYRARDTRLDRDAALKILPDSFAGDADRLARFEREAKTLAALNHPHIAAIYGLEDGPADAAAGGAPGSGRTRVLAMELVEGEDLSAILARGPLPIDEALPMARQIAEALEAAHAQGVIHRDLKPANIKVRPDGTVKVLDFGLAKAVDPSPGGRDFSPAGPLANSPTITSPAGMTRAGVILGTAAYMAPEQARGRVVDSRADVWAFGCVLFEMLTGQQAFDGEDITVVLAKVIEREPDWTRLPPRTPALVTRLLHRALQKDRTKRLQHMGDARLDLDEALSMPGEDATAHAAATTSPANWSRRALALAATLAAGVALGVVASGYWPRASAPGPRALQFDIPLAGPAASRFTLSLSPDGRYLAYFAPGTGGLNLWLRDLSRAEADRLIENADSVTWLAWTGDARSLMAGATGGLRRFDVAAGTSLLQRGAWELRGTRVWLSDGRFLVGPGPATTGPLFVETATGRERALDLDASVQELRQFAPVGVGDAGAFLYGSERQGGSRYVCVARLDTSPRCAGPVNHDSNAWYFDGSLIYARGQTLIARAFDLETVRLVGDEQSLADGLGSQGTITAASHADTLAFSVGASGQRLAWKDRSGSETPIMSIVGTGTMALSPDGRTVLVGQGQGQALTMLDLTTGGSSRLGTSLGDPIWSPDGRRFAYRTATALVTRSVESPDERVIFDFKHAGVEAYTEDWSPDGQWLAVGLRSGGYQAALIPVGGGEPVRFVKNNEGIEFADEFHFSPNGRWIAFNATSGGRSEVFVVANPPTGQRWQVSTRGGMQARWRPASNTLHYLEQGGTMMEVAVQQGEAFSVGERKALFKVGFIPSPNYDDYRVAADGRFLVKEPVGSEAIRVIVNWTALLKKNE